MTEREQLEELTRRAIGLARSFIGVRETAPNRGMLIDRWIERLGLTPPQPWCLAFALGACYLGAWRQFVEDEHEADKGPLRAFPLTITGKVSRFWRKVPPKYRTSRPVNGAIYCRATDPSKPDSPGHCGIVVGTGGDHIVAIEGNTDESGGRDGDGVCQRTRRLSSVNLGYVSLVPPESVA